MKFAIAINHRVTRLVSTAPSPMCTAFLLWFLMIAVSLIEGCGSSSRFPSGQYVTNRPTAAADSIDDLATLADAVKYKDNQGIESLLVQGKAFLLQPGTRVAAGEISDEICSGDVESGEYIGKRVVFACGAIGRNSQDVIQ